jgi:hypothetical protein
MMRIALIATLGLAAGCGGGAPAPAQPSSQHQNVLGTYSSSQFWKYQFVYTRDTPGEQRIDNMLCPGSVSITRQDADQFSGTFTQSPPCLSVSGTVTGHLPLWSSVRIKLSAGGDFFQTLERLTGCRNWAANSGDLFGTILPARGIEARVGGRAHCPDGAVLANLDVAGTR